MTFRYSRFVPKRQRPPIGLNWALLPVVVALAVGISLRGDGWWALGIFGAGLLWLGGTWLLAPYSKWAWRMRKPSQEDFERNRQRADRLGRAPVVARVFRLGRILSGDAGRKISEDYESRIVQDRNDGGV